MDARGLVEHLVQVGQKMSMGVDDLRGLVLKLILLSMKYVDRKEAWAQLFPGDYVDWSLVEQHPSNLLGDASVWLSLLSYLTWPDVYKSEGEVSASVAPLASTRKNLRECGLDAGGDEAWTLACRCLLLCTVKGLPSLHLVELLTCQHFKRNTHTSSMELLSKNADAPFTPSELGGALCFVLKRAQVDARTLGENLVIVRAKHEERKLCMKMKSMVAVQGRPRLRDRVKNLLKTDERKTQVDITLSTWESYVGFCYLHSFPPTLSEAVKTRLYFLASQTRWRWREHLAKVLPSGGGILDRVGQHPVTQPDVSVLTRVVDGLSMDGCPPFPEMTEFRARCFQSFAVSQTQTMTLTTVLQLYVAAYQNPEVWKDVWKHCVGVISVQIIKDCEAFTNAVEFAADPVMRLVCRSI